VALAGHPDLAAPYAVLVLVTVLAGLLLAARAAGADAARRELVAAERLRIARDLHDVVGHGVAAITVQAGAGRMAIGSGQPADAARALAAIEEAGRGLLRDVRWLVGLLREEQEHPTLFDLRALVESARRAGLVVTLDTAGPVAVVTPAVSEAGYRIVQESLTNTLRHSSAARVRVVVAVADGVVRLRVDDDGTASPDARPGNGLRGVAERAGAAGGSARWGPSPRGSGWSVTAELPVSGRS
jgi:signal transduction histidine kinase